MKGGHSTPPLRLTEGKEQERGRQLAEGFAIKSERHWLSIRAVAPLIVAAIANGLGVPLGMNQTHPEFLDPDPSDRPIASHFLLREEPDEEGEEEEDDDKKNDDDHNDDDGYSE